MQKRKVNDKVVVLEPAKGPAEVARSSTCCSTGPQPVGGGGRDR